LAHAYHDQVLGFEDPRILKEYQSYKKSGHGDAALLYDGTRVRHYGLTDQKEFFAEMTEAYFGGDDFFPFNRAELITAEPEIYELMRAIWGRLAGDNSKRTARRALVNRGSAAHVLWYAKPAMKWAEALPVGNGRLGAMVFGIPGAEKIQLNEQTIWSGGPYDPVKDPQLMALMFQYGRYLLLGSSRPGGQPANLQGIWNEDMNPAWECKYTANINVEMNYWPAEVAGLQECVDPLVQMVQELSETGSLRRLYPDPGNAGRISIARPASIERRMVFIRRWVCQTRTNT
jgi:hypothetical protein